MRNWLGVFFLMLALSSGCGDGDDNGTSVNGDSSQTGDTQETVTGDSCEGVVPNVSVSITDSGFTVREVEIASGGVVRWVNTGNENHSVVSGEPGHSNAGALFRSDALAPGDAFCFTFTTSRDVHYHCGIHTNEEAEVEVDGDDVDDRNDDDRNDDRDDDRGRGNDDRDDDGDDDNDDDRGRG